MNLNKKLIIVLFAVIFASCSTNNNIQVIDSENIKIEELEKNFNRVIGNGVLQGKGKSNFVRKGRSGAKQTKSKENCRPVISEAQELVERYYGPVIPQ